MKILAMQFDDNKPANSKSQDNTQQNMSVTTVSMVEQEKSELEIKKPNLKLPEKNTIFDSTNPINKTYHELQILRAKAKNKDLGDEHTDKLKQIIKMIEILTHSAQDDESDEIINFSAPKGFHGSVETYDKYEHDTTGTSYQTNNSAELSIGTKNTSTLANFDCDIGINKNKSSDSPVFSGFNKVNNSEYPPSDDIAPIPIHDRDIDSQRKYNLE